MTSASLPARFASVPTPKSPPPGGLARMSDRELLTLMIARLAANPRSVVESLFDRFGGLAAIAAANPGELARVTEAGEALGAELTLLREVAVRLARIEAERRPAIASWTALVDYLRAALAHAPREQFRALYLDRKNTLLREELIGHGTIDHAPVYPREVIRRALDLSASALILVHNHPSGDPTPSRADIETTRKIVEAARVFDLQVHDHVVVGRNGTASFRQLGLI